MENCSICNSDYKKAYKSDHLKSIKHLQKLNQYYCKKCNTFMPLSDKSNHLNSDEHKNKTKQQREATQIWCEDCGKYISNSRHFQSEIHTLRSQNNAINNTLHGVGTNVGTNVGTGVEIIVNEKTYIKLRVNPTNHLEEQINDLLKTSFFPRYKFQLSYLAKFSKIVNGEENVFHKWVKSDFNYNHAQLRTQIAAAHAFGTNPNIHNILMQKLDDEQLEGSGFVLNGIVNVIMEVYKVNDIQASSWVELPEKYKNNKSIINIKNDDQYCFLWCILAHLFPVEDHKNRTSSYSMNLNKLISNGLEFPMKIKDIPKFENLNNLNVNVFELTKTVLTPIHINTNYDQPQIDLMLYQNHYCLITKLHCLLNKDSHMKWVCRRCLTAFSSQPVLFDHIERCIKQQPTNITFSWKDHLKFEDYHMKVPIPIRVYADFECINQPTDDREAAPQVLFKQIPIAVGFYIISPFGNNYSSYFGESCVTWFVNEMLTLENIASNYFETNLPLEITPEEEESFQQSKVCWLCENPLGEDKVRDHDHLTGKYRGAAHNKCNLNCKKKSSSFVPIFFHNFSGYDCHLIFEKFLTQAYKMGCEPKIIPKSMENYVSVQVGCLKFLDSYRFLSSSLQKLITSLNDFPYMQNEGLTDDLFKKKLAYPYEKFNLNNLRKATHEPLNLNLTKEDYWSTLNQSYPCEDDIKRTQQLIDTYNITTAQELTMLYLKMDVLQLTDVFENFVETSTLMYGINPLYSYSLPGYTWKAGLKLTKIKLDFIKDKQLLLLLENNIRGGISSVMGPRFIESNENTKLLYIDANNLYGWAMSQYLPTSEFEKLDFPEGYILEQIVEDLRFIPDNNEYGYFIECDMIYPAEIKEKTENFPLCPYQTKADPNLFSEYMNSVKQPNYKPTEKLMCDLTNKYNYMMHYRMFKFYTQIGMKVTKIHTIYRFKQSLWLEKYINHNTQKRTKAKTNFEKDLYKLMNNAFFGKTMENVRERTNLEFIPHTNIDQIIKRQSKLSFKGIVNHYSEFSIYKFDKEKVIFDKPIYLGFSVLELSKLLMYEFYYHKLQPYYGDKIKLHYMDTDSFILSIKTGDLINDLEYFKDDFDFSELDPSHELYNSINKKVIGKMKIETSPIIELDNFVALRSKSYSFSYGSAQKLTQRTIQKSKQKGIQHTPIYSQFINSLFNSETTTATNYSIRSNAHNLTVQKQDKLALNPFDDKRMYLNPIQSLSWDKHTQKGDCPCILCIKLVGLYYAELSTRDGKPIRDEEIYYNIWTLKEKLNHQDLLNLISDRAYLL